MDLSVVLILFPVATTLYPKMPPDITVKRTKTRSARRKSLLECFLGRGLMTALEEGCAGAGWLFCGATVLILDLILLPLVGLPVEYRCRASHNTRFSAPEGR